MAREVIKLLGQYYGGPGERVVYTVPSGTRTVISRIYVTGNNTISSSFLSLAIVVNGNNDLITNPTAPKDYLLWEYAFPTAPHTVLPLTFDKITLDEKDDVRFTADVDECSCHVYGVEVLPEKN